MGLETSTIVATECATMPSSGPIVAIIETFRAEFTEPTWTKVVLLLWGTILARGRRTVTAALRQMGLDHDTDFSKYHHVFNRAAWSPLRLACRLTCLLVRTFFLSDLRLTFVIDETLERRWGRRIRIRGHYRDPLASSKERSVAASGIRWIVLALLVTPPWSTKPWALPVLSLPSPTPPISAQLGRRPKTIAEWARQMILCVRRWLPGALLTVVGDQTSSAIALGLRCRRHRVRLIAPLRLDARLFTPPPPRPAGTIGRRRIVGERLPNLEVVLTDPSTVGEPVRLSWYDGSERTWEVATGTALWYSTGQSPCRSAGCSVGTHRASGSRAGHSRPVRRTPPMRFWPSSSAAGPSKRHSRNRGLIWASRRNANGPTWRSRGRRRACLGCTP
jgi:hypothetical protein